MNRRKAIKQSGLLAATTLVASSISSKSMASSSSNGAHPFGETIDSTADCIKKAKICRQHCIESLSTGSTMMAECMGAVSEMLVACRAMNDFASQKSTYAKDFVKLCIEACQKCADACKPHRSHHDECRECYEACIKCIKACNLIQN